MKRVLPKQGKNKKATPIWRKEDRADHIYRVAAEVMCRKGYEATSMNDIADAVGLTKAGIYHYIRGKEQLLFEIMNFAMDMVDEDVMAPARENSACCCGGMVVSLMGTSISLRPALSFGYSRSNSRPNAWTASCACVSVTPGLSRATIEAMRMPRV